MFGGVDEAGRGPLAGPVVAAAVVLEKHQQIPGVTDSKKLSAARREVLAEDIMDLRFRSTANGMSFTTEVAALNDNGVLIRRSFTQEVSFRN